MWDGTCSCFPVPSACGLVRFARTAILCAMVAVGALAPLKPGMSADGQTADADGTIHVRAFTLPDSSLLDDETRAQLKAAHDEQRAGIDFWSWMNNCPTLQRADLTQIPAIRRCQAE